jgi:spore coat protein U-like protein
VRHIFLTLGLAALISSAALASTATANLGVSASITNNCIISTAAMAFGGYEPLSGAPAVNGTGTVTVACTNGLTGAVITLGQGLHAAGGSTDAVPLRQMQDAGTDKLTYKLYSDSGRTTVWGNTAGAGLAASTGTGTNQNLTVYGTIDSGQSTLPAGSYADMVVATITF